MKKLFLRLCYGKKPNMALRALITHPIISHIAGQLANTRASALLIDGFIRANNIDMSACESEKYRCFNDFFTRRLKPEARPIDRKPTALISPCDGYLSAYEITEGAHFDIKGSRYTVSELLGGAKEAAHFDGGVCLVIRLGVESYHRYCYIDDGIKSQNLRIRGRYNPVLPMALGAAPVLRQNTREYCLMKTDNFGEVAQIEVGACLVGRIENFREAGVTRRGEPKGLFRFGGSTIALLLERDALDVPVKLFEATRRGGELPVRLGERICNRK